MGIDYSGAPMGENHDHLPAARVATGPQPAWSARPVSETEHFGVFVEPTGDVHVNVRLGWDEAVPAVPLQAAVEQAASAVGVSHQAVRDAMRQAFQNVFAERFAVEIDRVVSRYRGLLREDMVTQENEQLHDALNRARLQERILAGVAMADQAQACELLGLSRSNPSATMSRKEQRGELLRFTIDGKVQYPLFQFDVEGRQLYPQVAQIIALARQRGWSNFRILNWFLRPHLDFDETPAASLSRDGPAVVAAFERSAEPPTHG